MYSTKKEVLQLVFLLKAHGIKHVVLCPGSRDIPIVVSIANDKDFISYSITDERSAAFFALGLCIKHQEPCAVCCTSGSALLNMHPAISEAYYQNVPLLVISADRLGSWINQKDGQTMKQDGIFASFCKKSINIPEIHDENSLWFANRLINEALLALKDKVSLPVHINVPIGDPFFDFSEPTLPICRVIERIDFSNLESLLNKYQKRFLIIGQNLSYYKFTKEQISFLKEHFVVITEHLSNVNFNPLYNFDALLLNQEFVADSSVRPDLIITLSGHIVSKRLKQYLRKLSCIHLDISLDNEVHDVFKCQKYLLVGSFKEGIDNILKANITTYNKAYYEYIYNKATALIKPHFAYCHLGVIENIIGKLDSRFRLHLSNSSSVRYAQFFNLAENVVTYANRGINGIEGSLSTALGLSDESCGFDVIIIGDLSFFYDCNALWQPKLYKNTIIVLINNNGGEIFFALKGLELDDNLKKYIVAPHKAKAKGICEAYNITYKSVANLKDLEHTFISCQDNNGPYLIEAQTSKSLDIKELKQFFSKVMN